LVGAFFSYFSKSPATTKKSTITVSLWSTTSFAIILLEETLLPTLLESCYS
jgi:hypothetical protein